MTETTIAEIRDVSGEIKQAADGDVTLYTIQADGGPYKTWGEEVAKAAFDLIGKTAEIAYNVETKTKGDRTFTNKKVTKVRSAEGATATAVRTGIPIAGQEKPANSGNSVPVTEDAAPARMSRGNGVKVAAHMLSFPDFENRRDVPTLFQLADKIAHYVATGEHPTAVPKPDEDIPF